MANIIHWVSTHIPGWFWITLVAHFGILGCVAYLILLERKIASWVQDRIGPNRVGLGFGIIPFLKDMKMFGLGQPLADGLKFIVKEDYRPRHVDKILFTVAPIMMIVVVIISIAVLPWGGIKQGTKYLIVGSEVADQQTQKQIDAAIPAGAHIVEGPLFRMAEGVDRGGQLEEAGPGEQDKKIQVAIVTYQWPFQIASLNIGVLYILAVLSLAVYGVVIGGWASNNKYSFLGGLRATANMISYEIPLGLSVLAVVVMVGTLDLAVIVEKQAHYWLGFIPAWNVFTQPLGFVLFLVCIHAEANRAPFDMAEAEQELVGGYHTEYSAMRFALFFLGEYAGMITTSAVCVALFFGGWHVPGLDRAVAYFVSLTPWGHGAFVDPANPAVTNSMAVCIVRALAFFTKTVAVIFVFMWVRWSLPRFRFDQVMMLAWRALIPISLALLLVTAIVVYLMRGVPRPGVGDNQWISGWEALVSFVANAGVVAAAMIVSTIIPPAPATNRKSAVPNSRFRKTPLPGKPVTAAAAVLASARDSVGVNPVARQAGF